MAINEVNIEVAIQELGLPAGSKFCGYIVHLPNEDEFIAEIKDSAAVTKRIFCKIPDIAKRYQDHKKAIKDAEGCKQQTEICLLFDVKNQYAVVPMGD